MKTFKSILDNVPDTLSTIHKSVELHTRASSVGFDWQRIQDVMDKLLEEYHEILHEVSIQADRNRLQDEIGDLLFVTTILARHADIDPERALEDANDKFTRRFKAVEHYFYQQKIDIQTASLDDMDRIWDKVKKSEK